MENKINKVITLDNGMKYFVIKQAIYKNENYFLVAEVSENGEDLKEKFALLHGGVDNGQEFVELVTDPKITQVVLSHINIEGN